MPRRATRTIFQLQGGLTHMSIESKRTYNKPVLRRLGLLRRLTRFTF